MQLLDYLITILSYIKQKDKRNLIKHAVHFKNKEGIEIGGSSNFFKLKSPFPIYIFAKNVDGVNFNNSTLWENSLIEGPNYQYYKNKRGYQYIAEASDLNFIAASNYDFVLSCHSLEHVANPIKALFGWKRLLKETGKLVLVLPDKENTFDINRPYTSFEHLIDDYNNEVGEDDETHFQEVISLHDFSKETVLLSKDELEKRTNLNIENRAVHHHVFSLEVIKNTLEYVGFEIEYQQKTNPFHLITIAKKVK
jgi:SAM-dependent methyltransferase